MAHLTAKNSYRRLEQRLNRFPEGALPSETLYEILRMLFNEEEAALAYLLPIRPRRTPYRRKPVSGLRYLRAQLPHQEHASAGAGRNHHHTGEFRSSGDHDGH